MNPDYTIAHGGQGARLGQQIALSDTPCHGDVFHIQHQFEGVANVLARLAQGGASCRQKLLARLDRAAPDEAQSDELDLALQADAWTPSPRRWPATCAARTEHSTNSKRCRELGRKSTFRPDALTMAQ